MSASSTVIASTVQVEQCCYGQSSNWKGKATPRGVWRIRVGQNLFMKLILFALKYVKSALVLYTSPLLFSQTHNSNIC